MKFEKRKEMERLALSVFLACLFHLLLFVIVEYGGLFQKEKEADYIGPLFVELAEVTSIPEAAKVESPEKQPEKLPPVETVKPEKVEEPSVERDAAAKPEKEAPGDKGRSDIPTVKKAESSPESLPEAEGESVPETYTPPPKTAPTVIDESIYDGKDRSNEFTVRMSDKADKAKPNFKIPIELPEWVTTQNMRLEVTFSFIVGTNGMITYLHLDEPSGYDEVDRAVQDSLLKWKFTKPFEKDRIMGTFTYRTRPR
jgi:outer membrane biosynthesis protein TonB